jgi:type II secretory pathway pseudopilin PulG
MRTPAPRRQSGFTYLGLMAAVVILGILLTVASRVWSFSEQRDKEVQLLWVGDQYRLAIGRYFTFVRHYPLTLQNLLLDDTSPVPRRFLRQLYSDPITGEADWTLILDPSTNGIMGVASKSKLTPIKRRRFPDIDVGFADTECYCDWKFIYVPRFYRRDAAPGQGQGQGQYAPAPVAPALTPACDPSADGCVPPPPATPPRTPPRLPPPSTPPPSPFPNWPPRTH